MAKTVDIIIQSNTHNCNCLLIDIYSSGSRGKKHEIQCAVDDRYLFMTSCNRDRDLCPPCPPPPAPASTTVWHYELLVFRWNSWSAAGAASGDCDGDADASGCGDDVLWTWPQSQGKIYIHQIHPQSGKIQDSRFKKSLLSQYVRHFSRK